MRKAITATISLLLAAGAPATASAQDIQRFQMQRTDNGFMVMDTQTGAASFCRERSGEFVCNETREDQAASQSEIDNLRKKVTELEARIEALEGGSASAGNLPSETEFEQTLNFMERFFRRFVDIVKGLETEDNQPAPVPPGRT